MVLTRWDPFRELRRMDESMNRPWRGYRARRPDGWSVPLDVVRDGDNTLIHASLPGVKPEDINVTIEDGLLTIRAEPETEREGQDGNYLIRERRTGKLDRTLRLPQTVDADKVESRYKDGVLTITLPKVEAEKAKHIEVKAA